jgi:peptidyl-dipeptidase Dcp
MYLRFRSPAKLTTADAVLGIIVAITHITAISVIAQTSPVQNPNTAENPLLSESSLPYHIPPFDKIKDEDFVPAIEQGMRDQLKEVETVADNSEKPTFDNTIVALERTGRLLDRAQRTFSNLNACNTNPTLQKIDKEMSPKLAAHRDEIFLNPKLFARVQQLYDNRDKLGLDPESAYLLERYYKDFIRAGAKLSDADKEKLKKMNAELATLQTQFEQNVLKEKNASSVVVDHKEDLSGLSNDQMASVTAAAKAEGKEGKFVIQLQNTTGQPLLGSLQNRQLRERIMQTSLGRNSHGGEFDTRDIVKRMAELRAEKAQLLGYANWAAYQLEDQTAHREQAPGRPHPTGGGKRESRSVRHAEDRGRRKRPFPNRVMGLAFLFREGPQGALRFRRIGIAPVLRTKSRHSRWSIFRGEQGIRPHLQGAPRYPRLSARCARI